jgi:AraC-like DNA-binding protein
MPYVQNGKDNKSMIENRFMAQVNEYVKANIANPAITVEDIASAVNMSRTLFFTRIKQVTGLTPNEFLRTTRLKVAAELLAGDNKLRVTEICYMVGFSSTSYFAKCFQAQFGMLPNQYMEQFRNQ